MGYAVVLFSDPSSCQRMEDLRNGILQAAGLPFPGNGRWRPRITPAMFDGIEKIEPAIRITEMFSRAVSSFKPTRAVRFVISIPSA
jgi:hypothetical protein